MTAKEQVLKNKSYAYYFYNPLTKEHIVYNGITQHVIATGQTEEQAWQNALTNIQNKPTCPAQTD